MTTLDVPDLDALTLPPVDPVRLRRGRMPMFYRDEVERIRADTRPIAVIAEAWGVSFDTIQRVRQAGRFEGVPYIARDEVDELITLLGNDTSEPHRMAHFIPAKAPKKGRPFKTGRREPLTEEECKLILTDPRKPSVIAKELNISSSYVSGFRRANGITRSRGPLDHNTIAQIRADTRDPSEIAAAHSLPLLLVLHLRGADHGPEPTASEAKEAA